MDDQLSSPRPCVQAALRPIAFARFERTAPGYAAALSPDIKLDSRRGPSMPEQPAKDLLLADPLSEVTRKERRMLLGVSMLAVALVKTGLVPTKIEALGVEFDKSNQQALLSILAVVTLYFLAAFVIYAAADFLAWRRALHRARVESLAEHLKREREGTSDAYRKEQMQIWERSRTGFASFALAQPVGVLRALFEFLLPLLVGVYATWLLWFAAARI